MVGIQPLVRELRSHMPWDMAKNVGFLDSASGKELACQCRRHRFYPWVGKIPWRRAKQLSPVFLPGESHGQRTWRATVHRVPKSWILLKWLSTHAHIVDLQYWVYFRCIARSFSYICMCVYYYVYSFSDSFPYRLQSFECSPMYFTVGLCWLFILYTVVCLCQSHPSNLIS